MSRLPLYLCACLMLSACGPGTQPEPESELQVSADPAGADRPAQTPEVDEAEVPRYPAVGAIGFQGFGMAPFGADQEAVRMAWGRDLGDAVPAEPGGCYCLAPHPRLQEGRDRIAFMIDGDRFVRIDVTAPDIEAPGGGRAGLSADVIHGLYGEGVEERPHKYIDGGHYLRVADPVGGEAVLLFETGADGYSTRWRIGLPPQIDWVEGCG